MDKGEKFMENKMSMSEIFMLAAELEDPYLPDNVVMEVGTKHPGLTKECWDLLREYGLMGSGYVQTHAQTMAFCLASILAEEQEKRAEKRKGKK
jgi:hypothetical protein